MATIGTIQHKMTEKIATEFPQANSQSSTFRIISSMIEGLTFVELGLITKAVSKNIPVPGSLIEGVSTSAYTYYSKHIIGDIFKDHFTSGRDLSIDHTTIVRCVNSIAKHYIP